MSDRDCIRWLLRPLGEPAFLRLYRDTQRTAQGELCPRYPWRLFEETFWSLEPDSEHPADARAPAWRWLRERLGAAEGTALGWLRALVHGLRTHEQSRDVHDLACFWAAPELVGNVEDAAPEPGEASVLTSSGYHEIHCHVRGAVPFLHLWQSWLTNDRARALLRKHQCKAGSWQKTWAELVNEAKGLWDGHLAPECEGSPVRHAAHEPEHLRDIVDVFVGSGDGWDTVRYAAGRYLAIYTAVRRFLLFQRGKAGLVRFTREYDRYSKLQKRRGRRAFDQTRRDVVAILERFHAQDAVAVELRPTMDTHPGPFKNKLQSIVLGYFDYVRERGGDEPIVMGLVPSLYKQEACGTREDDGTGEMWEVQAQVWNRQLDILFALIDEVPALRFFVVGVDAAGRERGCPPRVLGPLMQRVREHARRRGVGDAWPGRRVPPGWIRDLVGSSTGGDASRKAFERLNGTPVPFVRLGRTVHAGEDFVDPMTGLRHIWETLDACDFGPGDRVGHALAAGLDADEVRSLLERRCKEAGEVTRLGANVWQLRKPRGVHALDLAWLAQMTTNGERARWLAELGSVSASLLGVPANVKRLASHLQIGLHLPAVPAARFLDPDRVDSLDCTWHRVDKAWLALFEDMRKRVLAEIARRRVVVESCPSSNLAVIGLQSPPIERFIAEGVRCAVATDDPGLLDAWPRRELGLVPSHAHERVLQQSAAASFVTRAGAARVIRGE